MPRSEIREDTKNDIKKRMLQKLELLYGNERKVACYEVIIKQMEAFQQAYTRDKITNWVDEKDTMLITYGDQFQDQDERPLTILKQFADQYLRDIIHDIHILPFYPYTSDDGFSVVDYLKVDPNLGTWDDVEALGCHFDLMFDGVINHISASSEWFQGYLKGEEQYKDFFIEMDKAVDVSTVTRPRTLPLLTKFKTTEGEKYIWTTFSEDQIDLNYKNEKVLYKIIEVLLDYVSKKAKFIRLDAIGYLWKVLGTSCIHLPEAHTIIQLFRDILDVAAPETILITETNVPHKDNVTYFGNGYNEAQMVYQFPLAPLVLHTYYKGNARHLLQWADSLEYLSERTAFFNFLASHDGVGVMPVKGILSEQEIDDLVEMVKKRGGLISYKTNSSDNTQSPYELNIAYFDGICSPDEDEDKQVDKFISAQSILLSLRGVPGIYVHSLLGSRNYHDGVKGTGRNRTINREKFNMSTLEEELNQPGSRRNKIFHAFSRLIQKRSEQKAFHPNAQQNVLMYSDSVFSLLRISIDQSEKIVALHNVTGVKQEVIIKKADLGSTQTDRLFDLVSEKTVDFNGNTAIVALEPYQVMWLKNV